MFFPSLLHHITYLSLIYIYLILLKEIVGTLAQLDLALGILLELKPTDDKVSFVVF